MFRHQAWRACVAIAMLAAAGFAASQARAGEQVFTLQAPFLSAPAGATHLNYVDLGDVRAAFATAAGPHTLIDLNDIDTHPDDYVFYETGFTKAGVTFTPTRGELYVTDPALFFDDHYGEGNFLAIDYGDPTDLLTLSFAPTHAFAFEFQFLSFPFERLGDYHFGVTLSNGLDFSLTTPSSFTGFDGLAFFGIVSDQAFSSVTLDFPDFGAYAIADNFRVGAPAPAGVPEPGAWLLMLAGFGLAGAALRTSRASPVKIALALAVAAAAVIGATPSEASVAYLFSGFSIAGGGSVQVTPGYLTQTTGFSCAYPCLSLDFDPAPSADGYFDRVSATADNGGGSLLGQWDNYAAGVFGRTGVAVGAYSTLAVADVGDYAPDSFLYLLDSPVGVFTYLSHGPLSGDTGPLAPTACLYTGDYHCGAAGFDFAGAEPGAEDVFSVALNDVTGGGSIVHLRFGAGAFGAPGFHFGANNARLAVIALPGGTAPPAGVPEPAAWALLLTGFTLAGAALRRRRAGAAA